MIRSPESPLMKDLARSLGLILDDCNRISEACRRDLEELPEDSAVRAAITTLLCDAAGLRAEACRAQGLIGAVAAPSDEPVGEFQISYFSAGRPKPSPFADGRCAAANDRSE